jgi:HEAT repeats
VRELRLPWLYSPVAEGCTLGYGDYAVPGAVGSSVERPSIGAAVALYTGVCMQLFGRLIPRIFGQRVILRSAAAHALDWLGDDRCVPALFELLNDSVPRVRAIALHALTCDECKLDPLEPRPDVMQVATDWAAHDPSRRVRQSAAWLLTRRHRPARPPI